LSIQGDHATSKSGFFRGVIKIAIFVAIVLVLSRLIATFVAATYYIPSGSMETTVMTGDMVYGEKVSYKFSEPQRGDIIVFEDKNRENYLLLKRVVATAGQTVDFKDGKLVVDGNEVEEEYTHGLPSEPLSNSSLTFPYKVEEGCVFVMGDNRTNSQDSRYFGSVEISKVEARAFLVFWPLNHFHMV
jgi:signal peptidase I